MTPPEVRFDESGLAPAIVQDATTSRVLMLGYVNEESLRLTCDTGLITFWSRSRRRLWRKGETSGNSLQLVDITADCDGDAVLILAEPAGPTCHEGSVSCFGDGAEQGFAWLERLWEVIAARSGDAPPGSHTASLLCGGVDAVLRKVAEEATEVVIAAKNDAAGVGGTEVVEETADLLYHLLVLLAERTVDPREVISVLRHRAG